MSNVPVDPIVETLIGGEWVDITADCRLNSADSGGGIEIQRGVPNEGNVSEPTQIGLVLNNREGKYSPANPNGPYWGLLGRNQPIRVGLSRIVDEFTRSNIVNGLGFSPDKDLGNDLTKAGLEWDYIGATDRWDLTSNTAIASTGTGVSAAVLRGAWADCDVTVRVQTNALDSQFGIIFRTSDYDIGIYDPGFDGGVGGYSATGGSVSQTTALTWNGRASAVLLVSGSPVSSYVRQGTAGRVPVVVGGTYRAKMQVRSPTTPTVHAAIDWLDSGGNYLSTSVGSSTALTADTWTYLECGATAPASAEWAIYGPTISGSPANGTQLVVNDLRFHDYSALEYYAIRVNPTVSPDRLQVNRVVEGSSTAWGADIVVATGTWYWVQMQCRGQNIRCRIWEDGDPVPDWMNTQHDGEAYNDPGAPPKAGAVGFYTSGGTATVTFDSIQIDQWRGHAEITKLPPRYDLSRNDRWVDIDARGVLRRLGQGRKALEPALIRHLKSYSDLTVGWWAFDTGGGNRIPSRLSNGRPGSYQGLSFETPEGLPGVGTVASVNSDNMRVSLKANAHSDTGAWTALMYLKWDSAPASDTTLAIHVCSGTNTQFRIIAKTTGEISVWIFDATGTLVSQHNAAFYNNPIVGAYGDWFATTVYLFQDGSNVDWAMNYHKPGSGVFYTVNGTYAGSPGRYLGTEMFGVANHNAMGFDFCNVLGYAGDLPFVTDSFALAAAAYDGEAMLTRFARLCTEAGVPYLIYGLSSGDEAMGPQSASKLLDLLEECAAVQDAVLEEDRDSLAVVIRTRKSMYVQRNTELDLDAGHLSAPSEPTPDDQNTRNDVTITGAGSSARSIQTSGPLNINSPEDDPDGVGVYDTEVERNVSTPEQLPPIANWHRHKGTQPDVRYPALAADLTASAYLADPTMTAEVASIDLGDTMTVINTEVSPDPSEQIVQQTVEKIDQYEWRRSFVAAPAVVYRVGQMSQTTRLDTSRSVTTADFDSGTDTSLTVERTDADAKRWVRPEDQASAFPFDIMVDGVRLRVTDINGTTDPQTMVVEQTPVNGIIKTIPAGSQVRVYQPWRLAW